ncbi:MAG: AraC family transcriptional regulator [Gammaproteobacteria bacterium]|nr:AraC family transcriptional regulator [Gammaproteobacteria bacterium]
MGKRAISSSKSRRPGRVHRAPPTGVGQGRPGPSSGCHPGDVAQESRQVEGGATGPPMRARDTAARRLGPTYIRGCLQGAVRHGYDPHELLKTAGIDPAVYDDPSASIDGVEMQRLFVTVCNVMDDSYLGFFAVRNKIRAGYMVGAAAVNCATLGESLKSMARFVNAFRSDIRFRCRRDGDGPDVVLTFQVSGLNDGVEPQFVYWFETYWLYKFLCWLVGRRLPLTRVCIQASEGGHHVDYSLVFDCPIESGQDFGALYLEPACLKLPVVRTEAELRAGDFVTECSDWFDIPEGEPTLAREVEQLLMDLYREGAATPTLHVLADRLCASPRTISRRLKKENESFQDIKDRVRRELADGLLLTTEMPVSGVAERVGFAEPADFTRAYVRWTGHTPSAFRELHGH